MCRLKKIWADPVWSKVISAGIVVLISTAFVYFKGWWPYIDQWIFLKSGIPNWLLTLLCVLAFWKFIEIAIKCMHTPKRQARQWTSFRKAEIRGIVWRWNFINNHSLDEQSIMSYCPKCDYQLFIIDTSSFWSLECERCNKTILESPSMNKGKMSYQEFRHHIQREIEMQLRKVRKI